MSEEKERPVSRSREAFKARRKERARAKRQKGSVKAVGSRMAAAVVISIGGYIYQAGAYTDTYFLMANGQRYGGGGKTVGR